MTNILLLSISHNSLLGGDKIDVIAKKVNDGWGIKIDDSGSYRYILPSQQLKELSAPALEKFIDGITMEDEPSFIGGLVFGFLNANWPSDKKLTSEERQEAADFVMLESKEFPELAIKYRQRIAYWATKHA